MAFSFFFVFFMIPSKKLLVILFIFWILDLHCYGEVRVKLIFYLPVSLFSSFSFLPFQYLYLKTVINPVIPRRLFFISPAIFNIPISPPAVHTWLINFQDTFHFFNFTHIFILLWISHPIPVHFILLIAPPWRNTLTSFFILFFCIFSCIHIVYAITPETIIMAAH